MEKLYVIIRTDLDHGPQLAQLGHGVAAFAAAHPEPFQAWATPEQRNIVCLAVPSAGALEHTLSRLKGAAARTAEFRETDLNGELTAIACGEEGAKLLSSLPLAGRPARAAAA